MTLDELIAKIAAEGLYFGIGGGFAEGTNKQIYTAIVLDRGGFCWDELDGPDAKVGDTALEALTAAYAAIVTSAS